MEKRGLTLKKMINTPIYVQVFCIFAPKLGVYGIQEDFIDF